MTIEQFNQLSNEEKTVLIFEASQITEKLDDTIKYQLFKIDNFYVESKTSMLGKFKRMITTYTLKDLPAQYIGEILAIPLVSNEPKRTIEAKRTNSQQAKYLR